MTHTSQAASEATHTVQPMSDAEYLAIVAECGEAVISFDEAKRQIVPPLPADMFDED
ncbi:hypothetical protein [Marinobacterium sp. BA1]|uniref:hypothetical protein n=1 Tax=Marinobacterium sp. BA1 TaxID=3138931 RepID=UPI0032E77A08